MSCADRDNSRQADYIMQVLHIFPLTLEILILTPYRDGCANEINALRILTKGAEDSV